MTATRIDSYNAAVSAINGYAGSGSPLTVAQYKANLDSIAAVASNTYDKIDCSGFTSLAHIIRFIKHVITLIRVHAGRSDAVSKRKLDR